ncbi:uncharacterized protein LOC130698487 [Daphnia carinata]|uniref:uncharacterized protein LOC130698487 n=1 Tax=Daphnia carinata TaxID=120202 RepID=UPI00257CE64D|nr:uncharacterized protein LOC130698487 [Daphnia carinata]
MYKSMTLLVLVALAACVVSMETQDQEAAEQYYRLHGYYPSWYSSFAYSGYPAAYPVAYPAASTVGIKNVAYPYYAAYPYAYSAYPYAAPYMPYVAPAAPAEAPAKV